METVAKIVSHSGRGFQQGHDVIDKATALAMHGKVRKH